MSKGNVVLVQRAYISIDNHLEEDQTLELERSVDGDYPAGFSKCHLDRVPPLCSSLGRIGLDIYSVFIRVLCLSMCLVHVQSDNRPNSNGFDLGNAPNCLDQCVCAPLSTTLTSHPRINVSCVHANLKEFPEFSNMEISVLNLSGNLITELLSHSFENLRFLQVLNLAHNQIPFINASIFDGLDHLTSLHLEHNSLYSLHEDSFASMPRLQHLDISYNLLGTLPSGLFNSQDIPNADSKSVKNPDLRYLEMSHNKALGAGLSSDMFAFTKLQYLGLSNIGISEPDVIVEYLARDETQRLNELDISNNQITFLLARQLDVFNDKVQMLNLSGNPFNCDCSIISMVQWIQTNARSVMQEWLLPTCQSPDHLRNYSILNLTTGQVKVNCDLAAKCRNKEHFLSDETFDPDRCRPVVQATVGNMAITTTSVSSTVYVPYDHIRSTYDPMLGWYTAMALGGMVLLLIVCIAIEQCKKKYQNYRHRLWRRKIRKAMLEARAAAAAGSHDGSDLMSPLQSIGTSTYSYTNEVNASDYISRSRSSFRQCSVTSSDTCNNVLPSSRRVSVSWGPTCRMTQPDASASKLSVHSSSIHQPNISRSESLAERRPPISRQSSRTSNPSVQRSSSTATDRRPPQTLPLLSARPSMSRTSSNASSRPPVSRQSSTTSTSAGHGTSPRPPASRQSSTTSPRPPASRQSSTTSPRPPASRQSSTTSPRPPASRQSSTTSSSRPPVARASSATSARPTASRQSSTTSSRPPASRQSSTTSPRQPASRQNSTTSAKPPASRQSSAVPPRSSTAHSSTRPAMSRSSSSASSRPPTSRANSTSTDRLTAPRPNTNVRPRPVVSRSSSAASSGAAFSRSTSSATSRDISGSASPSTVRLDHQRPRLTANQRRASYAQTRSNSRPRSVSPTPTRLVTPIVTIDGEGIAPSGVHYGHTNAPNAVQSLWNTLEQVIRELKVSEINPDCPLHNKVAYQKLKTRMYRHPDQSLEKLLEHYDKSKL